MLFNIQVPLIILRCVLADLETEQEAKKPITITNNAYLVVFIKKYFAIFNYDYGQLLDTRLVLIVC